MCVLRPCRQKGAQSLRCESRILGARTAATVAITNCPCNSQTQTKTNGECVGSMLLECLESDADVSVVIALLQWLNQLQNYSRDTSKYSQNESKTRLHTPCHAKRLTGVRYISTWLSYRLETVTLCLQGTFVHQAPIGVFSSHFHTLVLVWFPFQHFQLAPSLHLFHTTVR